MLLGLEVSPEAGVGEGDKEGTLEHPGVCRIMVSPRRLKPPSRGCSVVLEPPRRVLWDQGGNGLRVWPLLLALPSPRPLHAASAATQALIASCSG